MEGSGSAAPQPLPAPSSPEYRYNPARWAQRQDAISLLWVQQELHGWALNPMNSWGRSRPGSWALKVWPGTS